MALCTFAITAGHDLKPHRGKGRPIETSNWKIDYEYPNIIVAAGGYC